MKLFTVAVLLCLHADGLLGEGNHCGIGFAYHTGTMINDNAFASNARDCLAQCNSNHQCKFWDYGGDGSKKYCRLRSSQGTGPIISEGFSYGSKHCILKHYVVGSSGTLCENGMIDNLSECQKAAKQLNLQFKNEEDEEDEPRGCYAISQYDTVYFNKNLKTASRRSRRPICESRCSCIKHKYKGYGYENGKCLKDFRGGSICYISNDVTCSDRVFSAGAKKYYSWIACQKKNPGSWAH